MVCRGITPKYNPYSDETVLGQTCVRNNLVLLENGRLHSPKKVTEKWLQKYDLLINSTGVGSLGRTAQVWFEPTKLVVDSHVTIVRCKDKKHTLYLGFWAFEHEKYIESLHTGSTGQTELPRDHVKAIRLVLPSDEALERFNKMSEPSVRLIAANQEENKRLADLRDALLPKLVSGEIDVSKVDLTQLNSHLAGYRPPCRGLRSSVLPDSLPTCSACGWSPGNKADQTETICESMLSRGEYGLHLLSRALRSNQRDSVDLTGGQAIKAAAKATRRSGAAALGTF